MYDFIIRIVRSAQDMSLQVEAMVRFEVMRVEFSNGMQICRGKFESMDDALQFASEQVSAHDRRGIEQAGEPFEGKPEVFPEGYVAPGKVVYFFQSVNGEGPIKIGWSTDIRRRLEECQSGSPVRLRILVAVRGEEDDERILHHQFAKYRLHNEWFEPHTDLLSYIERLKSRRRLLSFQHEKSTPENYAP